jgi:hypothetical protein
MDRLLRVFLLCIFLFISSIVEVAHASFAHPETSSSSESLDSTTLNMSHDTLLKILSQDTSVSSRPVDAKSLANIATILLAAQSDSNTQVLVENIREKAAEHFQSLHHFHRVTSSLDKPYVVSELANIWSKMNAIESIMQKNDASSNPANVLAEMQQEDLMPDFILDRMEEVVIDDLSAEEAERRIEDTRHSWYVAFLSYAAAGGYLQYS